MDGADTSAAELHFANGLRFFLAAPHRAGHARVRLDGASSLGHLIESLGVPRTETGRLEVNGHPVSAAYRPSAGDVATVDAIPRPQPLASARFLLDVHLGALARRMRLIGIDTAYANDLDDDTLLAQANADHRILLTQDRGLLRRSRLWSGGYVRGSHPDDQLHDVLERFAPPLVPWTRCPACNGLLEQTPKAVVEDALQPGTRRTYQAFSRCTGCGRLYWRGAHSRHLDAIVQTALRTVAAAQKRAGAVSAPRR